MKKQKTRNSVKFVKLSFFQLKKIRGRGEEGYPADEYIRNEEGNP